MNFQNFETFEIHAEFCKAIANPKRLMIINLLGNKKMTVGDLAESLNLSVSNISQHLKVMKNHQVVRSEKSGHQVLYWLSDRRLVKICENIREIIHDLYTERRDIFSPDSTV